MANGTSLSPLIDALAGHRASDVLTGQSEKLQEIPWWKTVGNVALPFAASLLMGPLGAALSGMTGFGSGLAGLIGSGLTQAGAIGTGIGGAAKTAGATGMKALYNLAATRGSRGILDLLDPRSEKDITLEGESPLVQIYGKKAEKGLQKDYRKSKQSTLTQDLIGSIMGAVSQQGKFSELITGLKRTPKQVLLDNIQKAKTLGLKQGTAEFKKFVNLPPVFKPTPIIETVSQYPTSGIGPPVQVPVQTVDEMLEEMFGQMPSRLQRESISNRLINPTI